MTYLRKILACTAVSVATALVIAAAGCSKDASTTDAMDGSIEAKGPDPCDLNAFFDSGGNGHACFPVSNMACFKECTTGGCTCVRNPAGGDHGLWKCVTDVSCMPDSAPFDDGATGSDAGALDASDSG